MKIIYFPFTSLCIAVSFLLREFFSTIVLQLESLICHNERLLFQHTDPIRVHRPLIFGFRHVKQIGNLLGKTSALNIIPLKKRVTIQFSWYGGGLGRESNRSRSANGLVFEVWGSFEELFVVVSGAALISLSEILVTASTEIETGSSTLLFDTSATERGILSPTILRLPSLLFFVTFRETAVRGDSFLSSSFGSVVFL